MKSQGGNRLTGSSGLRGETGLGENPKGKPAEVFPSGGKGGGECVSSTERAVGKPERRLKDNIP